MRVVAPLLASAATLPLASATTLPLVSAATLLPLVSAAASPAAPDYYDSLRLADSGFDAYLSSDTTDPAPIGSNMIRFVSDDATYRLADITALLPYTFGSSGSTAPLSGAGIGLAADDGVASSDAAVRTRSSVHHHAAALLLACHHFNNKALASVLPELPPHLADAYASTDVRLTASIYDTQFSPIESTRLLTQVLDGAPRRDQPLPQAILGAYRSACTSPTAILSGVNNLPQLSYHSSGTDFDNKEQYPLFGRTVPSSSADASAVVSYLRSLGVDYLGVIFVTDAFGSAYQKSLQDAAGEVDPPMRTDSVSFSYKSAATFFDVGADGTALDAGGGEATESGVGAQEIRNAIQSLKSTNYRYFVAIVGEEHYNNVMMEATRQGIAGGDYVWLFTSGLDRRTFQDRIARYPRGSPIAASTAGVGFIQVDGGRTQDIERANTSQRAVPPPSLEHGSSSNNNDADRADVGYHRFRQAWREATSDDELVSYFRSKQSAIVPPVGGHDFDSLPYDPIPSQHTYFVYDAVVSLGLGMAYAAAAASDGRSGTNDTDAFFYPAGPDIYDAIRNNVTFEGASGSVRFDPATGTRDYDSVSYTVWNAIEVDLEDEEGMVGFDLVPTSHYVAREATADDMAADAAENDAAASATPELSETGTILEWIGIPGREFVYADGTSVAPDQLPPVHANMNYVGRSGRIVGLALMCVVIALALAAMVWTAAMHKTRVVRASRPLFLALVCVGCLVMALAIVPLSQDETTVGGNLSDLSEACMAAPWLYVLGFAIAFSALFTKTWTLSKAHRNPEIDCVVVTWKDLLKTTLALLVVNAVLLLSWTLVSPLDWVRYDKDSKDAFDRTTETYATCTSDRALPFIIVIIVFNLGLLLFANFQSYQARDIQTEYQESRYVAISMASILQAWCMGIPIMIVVKEAPQAKFFVEAGIIFVTCAAVLLLVFIPKLLAVRSDAIKEEEERRRNRLRNVNARAGRGQFDDEDDDEAGGKKERHPQDRGVGIGVVVRKSGRRLVEENCGGEAEVIVEQEHGIDDDDEEEEEKKEKEKKNEKEKGGVGAGEGPSNEERRGDEENPQGGSFLNMKAVPESSVTAVAVTTTAATTTTTTLTTQNGVSSGVSPEKRFADEEEKSQKQSVPETHNHTAADDVCEDAERNVRDEEAEVKGSDVRMEDNSTHDKKEDVQDSMLHVESGAANGEEHAKLGTTGST